MAKKNIIKLKVRGVRRSYELLNYGDIIPQSGCMMGQLISSPADAAEYDYAISLVPSYIKNSCISPINNSSGLKVGDVTKQRFFLKEVSSVID